jgi:predicted N-formylglutamate amidohydrolase
VSFSAVERVAAARAAPPVLICCEHASNALPPHLSWSRADLRLCQDHWAFDPGAADVTRRLAELLGAPAVLAGFSRLVVDPNRPLDSETLFRTAADGLAIDLNRDLTSVEREERIELCYRPYHAAVDSMLVEHPGVDLLSIHTYTPCYEGQPRAVEIGVLFDLHEAWAEHWFAQLSELPYDVRRNEPWSGKAGLMYAPQHHAVRHRVRAVELEIRNDLATDPVHRERIVAKIVEAARTSPRG